MIEPDEQMLKVDCPELLAARPGPIWMGMCPLCKGKCKQSEVFLCEHEGKSDRFSYATCLECGYRFPIKHGSRWFVSTNTADANEWYIDANNYCSAA